MNYIKIEFKGGWALLAEEDFDPDRHRRYHEPLPLEQEGVTADGSPRRGRHRLGVG